MRLQIRSRGIELTDALRAHTTRRLQFALGRVASRVQRVDVALVDLNGPRGGIDKACRILVRGPGIDELFVEARAEGAEAAVAAASERVARTVHRALGRLRMTPATAGGT